MSDDVDRLIDEQIRYYDERAPEYEGAPTFTQRRTLPGHREYAIVKISYTPESITAALDAVGWDVDIHRTSVSFFFETARPR